MTATESLKQAIIHGQMIGCNSNKPQLVRERAVELTGLLQEALASLQAPQGEFTKKMRGLYKQAVGTHWIDDGIVQELANAVPELCDRLDRLEAENKELHNRLHDVSAGNLKLKKELEEYHNIEKFVDDPPTDQQCCSCAVILRVRNKRLKEGNAKLLADNAKLIDEKDKLEQALTD